MKTRSICVLWFLLVAVAPVAGAQDEFDVAAVFNSRCGACHTVGQGDAVGPDLSRVTERRDKAWLVSFVRSSQSVIGAGDPTALELFERFDRRKMPDHPYTEDQIGEILAYIEAGGPETAPRIRLAASATPEEIQAGRDYFFGRTGQGAPCASCHTVGASPRLAPLYLGGSLTHSFSTYRDGELARELARRRKICRRKLEVQESFLVRAFLRHVDAQGGDGTAPAVTLFPVLGSALAALLLGLGLRLGRTARPARLRRIPSPGGAL